MKNKGHGGTAASYFLMIMEVALLIFTASRTLDLLQQILPDGQGIFAYFGLVAFDVGIVGWTYYYAHAARGNEQRAIALLMICLSLLAVGLSVLVDLLLASSERGFIAKLPETARTGSLIAVAAVIIANLVAFFLTFIFDPERKKLMAMEQADDAIFEESIRQIKEATPGVAAKIAPKLTEEWVERKMLEHMPGMSRRVDSKAGDIGSLPGFQNEEGKKNGYKKNTARSSSNN